MRSETLDDLKLIYDGAPDGADEFFVYQGEVNYIDNHENGHQFKIWCEDEREWVFSELVDGWEYIRGRRSLSDIKLIIELMEGQKKAYQAYVTLEEIKQKYNGENNIAKELLKLVYECDEFALSGDLRKDIKDFLGEL